MSDIVRQLGYYYYRGGPREVSQRVFGHFFHGFLYHYNRRKLTDRPDIPRVIAVDPGKITISTIPKHRFPHKGPDAFVGELGGVWDRFRKPVESTVVYRSLYNRFENDWQWEETDLYRSERWKLARSELSIEQLEQHCNSIDQLYEDIKINGYSMTDFPIQRIEEFEPANWINDAVRVSEYVVPDEPRVGIGRDGTFIRLGGGRHRIAIAKLLGLNEIPAVLLVQHSNYGGVSKPSHS